MSIRPAIDPDTDPHFQLTGLIRLLVFCALALWAKYDAINAFPPVDASTQPPLLMSDR